METISDETKTLRRCVRDLVAISALPAVWVEYTPPRLAESLAEVLVSVLRADFVYVRLRGSSTHDSIELIRPNQLSPEQTREIARALATLKSTAAGPPASIPNPLGSGQMRLCITSIGMIHDEEYGVLVVGSSKPSFPTETDNLLLRVTANQATILFEHHRSEEVLRESERRFRTLFESMDEGYCVIEVIFDKRNNPVDYRFLEVNPPFEKQTGIKDAKGRSMREIAPNHEQHWFDIYGRIAMTGETLRFENEAAALGRYYDVCAFRVGPAELRHVGIVFNDITERKRREQRLSEQARLLDLSNDAIIMRDANDRITYWNRGAEGIYGWPSDRAIGKNLYEFLHAEFSEPLGEIIEKLRRDGRWSGESTQLRRDGSRITVGTRWALDRDEQGNAVSILQTDNDITERKRAEAALIERTQLATLSADIGVALNQADSLREILQLCTEAIVQRLDVAFARIWTLDENGRTLELQASAGMYTHLNGPHSRIPVGELKIGLIARDRKPHVTNEVIGDPCISDQEWAKREGVVAFGGYPLIVEDHIVGVVAVFARKSLTDPTVQALESVSNSIALGIERKQAEERLKEQTEIVETINRIGQVLSAELDLQKLVQAVTDAATELTGARFGSFFYNVFTEEGGQYMLYTLSGVPREAFGHFPMPRATDLFGPTFRGEGIVCIDDVKLDPRYGKNSPYYGMPSGHLPVTSYLAVPVISRSGEVLGGLFFGHSEAGVFTEREARIVEGLAAQAAVAMDNAKLYRNVQQSLAEREDLLQREQAARKQAEEASRAKDEFLGTLSHELRTPLNAIIGWTTILTRQKLDEDMFNRATETIDRNARLQARLVEDMLDVSRIISGNLRLDTEPVELSSVINAAIDTVRSAADAKNIRMDAVLSSGTELVLGDSVRLQQVVWNMLTNAVKFTPKGGHIQVQLQRIDSYLELTVSDTGPGIDEEFLPFVFDRFRQADSTSARRYGGLGLGLAIVRHLVELHGGTVEVENRAAGHGAVFTVSLPVMAVRRQSGPLVIESERKPSSGRVLADASPSLSGLKILIVDDEADARLMLAAMLEQCGAQTKTTSSTGEALQILQQYRPDILVSDIGMPDEDGYVLIKKVRSLEPKQCGRIPAVALTAYARAEDRLRALTAGYNMHVPKPVEFTELAIVIASLSGRNLES